MRTLIWYTYFWMFMIASIILYIPVVLLSFPQLKKIRLQYTQCIITAWAGSLIKLAGGNVDLQGKENLPTTRNVCYVANHQGAFDIPILLGNLPGPVGFVAKKELARLPIVNLWMWGIGCVFMNRSNRRAAVESIRKGVEQIRGGNPMIIFPEGTRSRKSQMNEFRPGSLKLATRSEALIVPVSISGSYTMKEQTGKIQPARVTVTVHPAISSEEYSQIGTGELTTKLKAIIEKTL